MEKYNGPERRTKKESIMDNTEVQLSIARIEVTLSFIKESFLKMEKDIEELKQNKDCKDCPVAIRLKEHEDGHKTNKMSTKQIAMWAITSCIGVSAIVLNFVQ